MQISIFSSGFLSRKLASALAGVVVFLLLFGGLAQAQFDKDYKPLRMVAPIPSGFISDLGPRIMKHAKNTEVLSPLEAKEFYELSEYLRRKIIMEGHIYCNDEVSKYLQALFNEVVPGKADEVEVLLADFQQYNAATLPNGTILINIGLLAQVKS